MRIGALVGAVVLRGREVPDGIEASSVAATLADGRLWRLSLGSGLYLYAQIAVLGFGVLFLVDEHGLSAQEAALVFAGSQVLGAAFRIGGGRWSDLMGARIVPLRRVGLADRRRDGADGRSRGWPDMACWCPSSSSQVG